MCMQVSLIISAVVEMLLPQIQQEVCGIRLISWEFLCMLTRSVIHLVGPTEKSPTFFISAKKLSNVCDVRSRTFLMHEASFIRFRWVCNLVSSLFVSCRLELDLDNRVDGNSSLLFSDLHLEAWVRILLQAPVKRAREKETYVLPWFIRRYFVLVGHSFYKLNQLLEHNCPLTICTNPYCHIDC